MKIFFFSILKIKEDVSVGNFAFALLFRLNVGPKTDATGIRPPA